MLRTITNYQGKTLFQHVRSHRDNKKNIEVDRLCDTSVNRPDRTVMTDLQGKKTAAKIKAWTKEWASTKRRREIGTDRVAKARGSETQKWMTRETPSGDPSESQRPREYNQLPRRKGVLLAKFRTLRYTNCYWYLNFIKAQYAESPLCHTCQVADTTKHVIDHCAQHEEERESMRCRLKLRGKVSDLLSSRESEVIDELSNFLIAVDDDRKRRRDIVKAAAQLVAQTTKKVVKEEVAKVAAEVVANANA